MKKFESDFQTIAYAKCILAGEHAVLRGHPAIVLPLKSRFLSVKYYQDPAPMMVSSLEEDYLIKLLKQILFASLAVLHINYSELSGEFRIKNSIHMASGMGLSSAICISVAKWLIWKKWLDEIELFNFARNLENNFHGKSSGVDIAGALADTPIYYQINHEIKKITMTWQPYLYLSYADHTCPTKICIEQVEKLRHENKNLAESLDQQMAQSVELIYQAITSNQTEGIKILTKALNAASVCFVKWGLVDPRMQQRMDELRQQGALAVKPTGSGGGGYLLSLWQTPPPAELAKQFINIFS